jgi:hypothetical protein
MPTFVCRTESLAVYLFSVAPRQCALPPSYHGVIASLRIKARTLRLGSGLSLCMCSCLALSVRPLTKHDRRSSFALGVGVNTTEPNTVALARTKQTARKSRGGVTPEQIAAYYENARLEREREEERRRVAAEKEAKKAAKAKAKGGGKGGKAPAGSAAAGSSDEMGQGGEGADGGGKGKTPARRSRLRRSRVSPLVGGPLAILRLSAQYVTVMSIPAVALFMTIPSAYNTTRGVRGQGVSSVRAPPSPPLRLCLLTEADREGQAGKDGSRGALIAIQAVRSVKPDSKIVLVGRGDRDFEEVSRRESFLQPAHGAK